MSKASRRAAGRKRKLDIDRQPNGKPTRGPGVERMHAYVTEARARKTAVTGRDDMPIDVLGIMLGHGAISEEAYQEGRSLERLMARIYGSPNESASAMFKESVSPPSSEDVPSSGEPMSDEAAEALFMKMDRTLRGHGMAVRDWVIGAVRYCRYPTVPEHVGMIITGLEALAAHRKPKDAEKREMVYEAA